MRAGLPAAWCATACGACRSPSRPTTPPPRAAGRDRASDEGVEEVVVGLTYSISPVAHRRATTPSARRRWPPAPDIDRLYLKDPGGLLTRRRACASSRRCSSTRRRRGRSSCTATARSGSRRRPTSRACEPASATLHTAVAPLANGTSQPGGRDARCATSRRSGFDHDLDLEALADDLRALPRARRAPRACRSARRAEYDAAYYRHQMPGGMVTTIAAHARGAAPTRAVRRRAGGGRAACAPSSATRSWSRRSRSSSARQAVMNVIGARALGERLRRDRSRYFLGHFGEPAAPRRPRRRRRVLSRAAGGASCATSQPISLEGARERFGARISEEELLLRLTMPAEQVDAMVAAAGARRAAGRPARPQPAGHAAARARPAAGHHLPASRARTTTRWCGAVLTDA